MSSRCNICGNTVHKIFDALLLGKYKVDYYQCEKCMFIQTEKPYWLKEAYVSAITSIDVGLVYRNILFSNIIPSILDGFSDENDAYIDYGGGYGMFVRIMRDKGYNYYLQDIYAENLFAKHFELGSYTGKEKFAALTAFEVFEHLEDPAGEIAKMLELSDTLIFSTDLQQQPTFNDASEWWYFAPETGQHVSFYSTKSLEVLSEKCNCTLYSNKHNLHILTKRKLSIDPFPEAPLPVGSSTYRIFKRLADKYEPKVSQRESLLQHDFELYKSKIKGNV